METVDRIERSHGKTRLGLPEKLKTFMKLMEANVDYAAIYSDCELP
jgi:hypothetical protein